MWYKQTIEEVAKKLHTNLQYGLSKAEAKRRLEKYGANKLREKKKTSLIIKFIKQFNDFMIIILLFAAVISAVMAFMQKTGDYIDSVIIIAIVVFNAIIGLMQETKAEKSLEALSKMASPTAKVRREGQITEIASEEVVPGDIIILETGNYIPADGRIINSYSLRVEESALTGETVPASKHEGILNREGITDADITNMVFAGTVVSNRTCRGNCM